MKFKVGDRVKTKVSHHNAPSKYNHTDGVITGIDKDSSPPCKVSFEKDYWFYTEDELELVTTTTLKELPNTVVHVETQEEYDELMRIYEDAGWKWCTGDKPGTFLSRGTSLDKREKALNGEGLVLTAFRDGGFFWRTMGDWEVIGNPGVLSNPKIISLKEFKEIQGLVQKPDNYDELLTTCTSTTSYGYLTEGALEDAITDAYRYAYTPSPIYPQWYSLEYFGSEKVTTKKKGIMSYLKDIPNRIKKLLSKDLAAMYKLGWIDEELNLTSAGKDQLNIILQDEYEVKLGAVAQKQVTKLEKECKK